MAGLPPKPDFASAETIKYPSSSSDDRRYPGGVPRSLPMAPPERYSYHRRDDRSPRPGEHGERNTYRPHSRSPPPPMPPSRRPVELRDTYIAPAYDSRGDRGYDRRPPNGQDDERDRPKRSWNRERDPERKWPVRDWELEPEERARAPRAGYDKHRDSRRGYDRRYYSNNRRADDRVDYRKGDNRYERRSWRDRDSRSRSPPIRSGQRERRSHTPPSKAPSRRSPSLPRRSRSQSSSRSRSAAKSASRPSSSPKRPKRDYSPPLANRSPPPRSGREFRSVDRDRQRRHSQSSTRRTGSIRRSTSRSLSRETKREENGTYSSLVEPQHNSVALPERSTQGQATLSKITPESSPAHGIGARSPKISRSDHSEGPLKEGWTDYDGAEVTRAHEPSRSPSNAPRDSMNLPQTSDAPALSSHSPAPSDLLTKPALSSRGQVENISEGFAATHRPHNAIALPLIPIWRPPTPPDLPSKETGDSYRQAQQAKAKKHELEIELLQKRRAKLAAEQALLLKETRRAMHELEMAAIDLRAAETRRKLADVHLEKARAGILGIDAVPEPQE